MATTTARFSASRRAFYVVGEAGKQILPFLFFTVVSALSPRAFNLFAHFVAQILANIVAQNMA